MKKLLCLFFLLQFAEAGAQSWDWLIEEGSTGYDRGSAITTDNAGNIYVTGTFDGSQYFGSTLLISQGGLDIFLAKYDPAGTLIWVRTTGSPIDDYPSDVCVDDSDNVYVCGSLQMTLNFGSDTLSGTYNNLDIFLAKYSNSGTLLWLKSIGGPGVDGVSSLRNYNSRLLMTGCFSATTSFDLLIAISNGGYDGFVGEIDTDGTFLWINTGGGLANDVMTACTLDGAGNISVIGTFTDSAQFSASTIHACGNWGPDVFIVQYDSSHSLRWLQKAGGTFSDYGYTICSDSNDNIYVTGSCVAYPNLPAFFAHDSIQLTSSSTFLCKFDPLGSFQWIKAFNGNLWQPDCVASIVDASDNIYLLCCVRDSAFIGADTICSGFPYAAGVFVAKISASGSVLGYYQSSAISDGMVLPSDFAMDDFGNIAITGMCWGTTAFGPFSTTDNGSNNIFIACISAAHFIGIDESTIESVRIYPNPSSEVINLQFSNCSARRVLLTDSKGTVVYETACHEQLLSLNVRQFPNGVYFVSVYQDGILQQAAQVVIVQ